MPASCATFRTKRSNSVCAYASRLPPTVISQSTMSTTEAESLPSLLPDLLPRLWAFSLRLCGNQHDAEDLLQRAFLRGLERSHQLCPDTVPLSWMFSIIHSIWINELRARKIRCHGRVEWDDAVVNTVAD